MLQKIILNFLVMININPYFREKIIMKNIANDVDYLDKYARELWGQQGKIEGKENKVKSTYYASTTSCNWFGFIERINECIQEPTWSQVKGFVEYYCKKRNVDFSFYINLYNKIEEMGYSATFKTTSMHEFYLKENKKEEFLDPFYREIFKYFD